MGSHGTVSVCNTQALRTISIPLHEPAAQSKLKSAGGLAQASRLWWRDDRLKQFCQGASSLLVARPKSIDGAHDRIDRAGSHSREQFPNLPSNSAKVIFHHFWFSGKTHPQLFVLRRNSDRTRV